MKTRGELLAEIERLRAARESMQLDADCQINKRDAEIARLLAQISELREEIDSLKKLRGTWQG